MGRDEPARFLVWEERACKGWYTGFEKRGTLTKLARCRGCFGTMEKLRTNLATVFLGRLQ